MDKLPGSLYKKLSEEELYTFLTLIRVVRGTSVYDFMAYLLGDDVLKFLDVYAKDIIKVPPREETSKMLEYAQIYAAYKSMESNPEVYKIVGKRFKRRSQSVMRIVAKVEDLLKKGEDVSGIK